MKKNAVKFITLALTAVTFVSATGCFGKPAGGGQNHDGKEILVSIYNGGLGTDWFEPVREQFEKDYPGYYVSVEKKKRTLAEIESLVALDQQADMYFSTVSDFHTLMYSGKIEDITDVYNMTVPGEDRTVGDKLLDKEDWKMIASKNGEGFYMLPYEDGITGFQYDHQKFVEYGLMIDATNDAATKAALDAQGITYTEVGEKLVFESSTGSTNYNKGDIILRAGKDAKFGTYDDGQPITMEEWDRMFLLLKGLGEAVIYTGKYLDYTTDILNGVFAQYDGVENWRTYNTYNGTYTFEGDTEPTTITMDNGYKVFSMTGIKKGTQFLQDYLNNRDYAHPSSFMSEESHTDAQGKFVLGAAKNSVDAPFTGLLVDGIWWEKEAMSVFNGLAEDSRYADYAYGKRDYRMMLYPQMEGQKGADGNGNGSVLSTRAAGACVVMKNSDPDILEKTKILLAYTLKDEYLRHFTKVTGVPRRYDYSMTEEDKSEMTKYASNIWELYADRENVKLVRPLVDRYLTPLPYMTSKGFNVNWYSSISNVPYNIPMAALRIAETSLDSNINSDPAATVFKGYDTFFKGAWTQYVTELRAQLG